MVENSKTASKKTVDILDRLKVLGKMPGSRGGKKLSKFMAREDEIRKALTAGFSVKDVYDCLRGEDFIDLSYSLFSEYVRTKLQLRPRLGFEEVEVVGKGESGVREPQLTEEEKRHNKLVHGHPEGPRKEEG